MLKKSHRKEGETMNTEIGIDAVENVEESTEVEQTGFNKETLKAYLYALAEFVAILNGFLVGAGKNPLPFDEAMVLEVGAYVLAIVAFGVAVWKNHNFTKAAQKAQTWLRALKEDGNGDF